MISYIAQRLVHAIPVLVGISVLSFLLLHLVPGDPVQIFDYASHAVRGDLGIALRSQRPVLDSILEVLPSTAQLTLTALALAAILGITLGIIAAVAHGSWLDTFVMAIAMLGI